MKDKKALGTQRLPQAPNPANQARNSVSWSSLEQQVVRMQKQIAQASQRGDRRAVHSLQQQLIESEAARLLAVRRAAEENQGKHTAGVDGIKSLGPKERLAMASTIHPKYWNYQPPMPVRRVWVPKPGTTERRPLAILPMIDRCKQALVKLALEAEWEAKFEPHSYGFRPGRSTHDAIAAIVAAIERQPMFVFDADIAEAFDHVKQAEVLDRLQTYPALRQVIAAWLTSGVLDGDSYSPSETGIAQGGILSPLLMNVALHGMEAVVTESPGDGHTVQQPLLVRYADDFVILHPDLKALQQAVRRLKHWLARMGLQLHADKTRFTHTLTPYQGQAGFDFLGFNIRQEPGENSAVIPSLRSGLRLLSAAKHLPDHRDRPFAALRVTGHTRSARGQESSPGVKTMISPSQQASKRHLAVIEHRLQQLQTDPQARVIAELNPLIMGWAAYYNGVVPAAIMSRYDELVEQQLINWARKRHPGKARDWLLTRYWQRAGNHRRVFATPDGVQLRAYQPTSVLGG